MRLHYTSGGPSVDLYDLRIQEHRIAPIRGDVAFYLKQARRTGGPILELGSGTGRVSLPLAEKGFEVVGLDLSPHMLKIAREKAARGPNLRVLFVLGDMSRFDLGRKFRLILIPFRAFQHLRTPEEQRRCLNCVRRHLAKGGRFILHLFDPRLEFCLPGSHRAYMERDSIIHPATGRRFDIHVQDRRNDPLHQTFVETWEWTERNRSGKVLRRWKDKLSLRWTYRWEMKYLLELAGFGIEACLNDFKSKKSPPRYGAEQIWVAR